VCARSRRTDCVQLLIMAVFCTCICSNSGTYDEIDANDEEQLLYRMPTQGQYNGACVCGHVSHTLRPFPVAAAAQNAQVEMPDEAELAHVRSQRMEEKKMWNLVSDVALNFFFVAILFIMAYSMCARSYCQSTRLTPYSQPQSASIHLQGELGNVIQRQLVPACQQCVCVCKPNVEFRSGAQCAHTAVCVCV
jgi:hypothetical protein